VPSRHSQSPALFVFNDIIYIVYTLLLRSSSFKGFLKGLFVVVSEGWFVEGVCIKVSMSVPYKVLARLFHRILEWILRSILGSFAYREG
jgi:hypothetical protein